MTAVAGVEPKTSQSRADWVKPLIRHHGQDFEKWYHFLKACWAEAIKGWLEKTISFPQFPPKHKIGKKIELVEISDWKHFLKVKVVAAAPVKPT